MKDLEEERKMKKVVDYLHLFIFELHWKFQTWKIHWKNGRKMT